MERDITEYIKHTITEGLTKKACVICHLARQREEKSFWWFFADNYHDMPVLADLMSNSFFCDYHASILGNNERSALSYIFQFLVQCDLSKLNEFTKENKNGGTEKNGFFSVLLNYFRQPRKVKHRKIVDDVFQGYTSCRFCRLNEGALKYIEGVFAELIREDGGFRDLYLMSDGLCRKHFVDVLKVCDDQASLEFLVKDMINRLSIIKEDFDLYFHRLDYRFSGEPKDEEQNTWFEALKYYSSKAGDNDP